jgi:capsular polysaccharide biosynthesis protein
VSVLRGNRRFLLVAVPIFAVAIGLAAAYLILRPTIRRNAAILVESKLRVAASVVQEVREVDGELSDATPERLNEVAPEDMEFLDADQASYEPLVVSVALTIRGRATSSA